MQNLEALTLEQARTIEAGVECDALVAEVVGVAGSVKYSDVFVREAGGQWEPSTDANAAIEAAWGVLPVVGVLLEFGVNIGIRELVFEATPDYDMPLPTIVDIASAPTFPLALCRAILVRAVLERKA